MAWPGDGDVARRPDGTCGRERRCDSGTGGGTGRGTAEAAAPTIAIDKTELKNGGTIKVTGQAPAGKPVYIEVWADGHDVRSSRFDSDVDKETKKRPYIFYLTGEMPAYYKILVPKDLQPKLDEAKKEGSKWSYSALLKDLGADIAYSVPAKIAIEQISVGPDGQRHRQPRQTSSGHGREGEQEALDAAGEGPFSFDRQGARRLGRGPARWFLCRHPEDRQGFRPGPVQGGGGSRQESEKRAGRLREQDLFSDGVYGQCRHQHEPDLSLCPEPRVSPFSVY